MSDVGRWDSIPAEYLECYESCGRSEEVGVAIILKLNRMVSERQLERLDPSRWMVLPYSQFVESPVESLARLGRFSSLPMNDAFFQRVAARSIHKATDDKWKNHFTAEQVRNLDRFETLLLARNLSHTPGRP